MKFTLVASSLYYNEIDANKLKKYGFVFTFIGKGEEYWARTPWRIANKPIIELSTLEELLSFCEQVGTIILNGSEIEIYNDYRE